MFLRERVVAQSSRDFIESSLDIGCVSDIYFFKFIGKN